MMTDLFSLTGKRIWVAGHKGMVGSAIHRQLKNKKCEILTVDRSELDLRNQEAVSSWVEKTNPEVVFLCAAKVGGIAANNSFPANFLYDNLMIEANIINAAFLNNVKKLLFLGSSCIYPREAPQPILEEYLLEGPLEKTNEWYAIAKIAGIKLCQAYRQQFSADFISAMPTNLYGPGDNYDLNTSHVLPALIRKIHEAKENRAPWVSIWGTGTPRREFLHVEDCARACIHLMESYSGDIHINVGSNKDITINELAATICQTVGYTGKIRHDLSKPDGTIRKLMCSERLYKMGWRPTITLEEGIKLAYQDFLRGGYVERHFH